MNDIKFPPVSQEMVDRLRINFGYDFDKIDNMEDLKYLQGQQSIIDYLQDIHKSQIEN